MWVNIVSNDTLDIAVNEIMRGESLEDVAHKYGLSIELLREFRPVRFAGYFVLPEVEVKAILDLLRQTDMHSTPLISDNRVDGYYIYHRDLRELDTRPLARFRMLRVLRLSLIHI